MSRMSDVTAGSAHIHVRTRAYMTLTRMTVYMRQEAHPPCHTMLLRQWTAGTTCCMLQLTVELTGSTTAQHQIDSSRLRCRPEGKSEKTCIISAPHCCNQRACHQGYMSPKPCAHVVSASDERTLLSKYCANTRCTSNKWGSPMVTRRR